MRKIELFLVYSFKILFRSPGNARQMGISTKEVLISISNTMKYKFQEYLIPCRDNLVVKSLTSQRSGLCFVFVFKHPVLLKLTEIIL